MMRRRFILRKLVPSLAQNDALKENVIRIEYVERNPPPTLNQEVRHNEWVSAVHCSAKL